MQDITNNIASIKLQKQDTPLSSDICTVHTTFEGDYNATIILCADTSFFAHLTQCAMQEEKINEQDIEDFAKEYLNVICGKIVAKIFQLTHISSRFSIPNFCAGKYIPIDNNGLKCVLSYKNNCNECLQLIHQIQTLKKA